MRETYLDNTADLAWLRDVHWPHLPDNTVAAILYGNEDAPDKIEAYDEAGYSDYARGPLATWRRPQSSRDCAAAVSARAPFDFIGSRALRR